MEFVSTVERGTHKSCQPRAVRSKPPCRAETARAGLKPLNDGRAFLVSLSTPFFPRRILVELSSRHLPVVRFLGHDIHIATAGWISRVDPAEPAAAPSLVISTELAPLLPKSKSKSNSDSKYRGYIAAKKCGRRCRRLLSHVVYLLRLVACLLDGTDGRLEKPARAEVWRVVYNLLMAMSSLLIQSFGLPLLHLSALWNFMLSVTVYEVFDVVLAWGLSRQLRAIGVAFSINMH
ncbi:hypothetical protein B0T26DRAFT_497121 [Lasiosphaeria miniovina]|uniref:Uncharacterized protein n=1 Tax=Lasiosphaeria miniovina TaxID=1954250 RepID=A0AA40DJU2_9PEZI|nr:uncharacterized protein B0T26DRAFT_497121 [Lasiosphaeria miniovina]KAK0703402.1 hypothetical protein B0T26DRAFT_497121 [Lasiosphaeria miniovina]